MKLLLDANLSWRMIAILKQQFDDCLHVDSIGISIPAKDSEIWEYARKNDLIIITNDEDFIDFINVKRFPPKVILLKIGNQSKLFVANLLIQRKSDIKLFSNSPELGLLEIITK